MSELLPTVQARRVRDSLVDYLTTTFALADPDAREGLDRFLADPVTGMFKGPYVRLRTPFEPATTPASELLEWYGGPHPYGHQAAAFGRLASAVGGEPRRPLPTLVTTGTGSGKTEAFLFPILDHVLRARREGQSGTKALLLYPMNALANDQARRLATLITSHPELGGVTAALYVGEQGTTRSRVTAEGLITDRAIIRDAPPDILLTNYKMLDQLLLRPEDADIWRASALSLRYLVLDEFHTYDGAQGTDVAMLLRRLGLVLKSHWGSDAPVTEDDRVRPLGLITPVATSATLGDTGDPSVMCGFAETVFGEPFGTDAVITETRVGAAEWAGDATDRLRARGIVPVTPAELDLASLREDIDALGHDPVGSDLARTVLRHLFTGPLGTDPADLLDLTKAHPLVTELATLAEDATDLADLAARTAPATALGVRPDPEDWMRTVADVIAVLGHVRSVAGLGALSVSVHLWVREVTRVDRAADAQAEFRWGDDGPVLAGGATEDVAPSFPAVYCRHCGRSGWMVPLNPVGHSLAADDDAIRRDHAARRGRTRALLYAPGEADDVELRGQEVEGLVWFDVRGRALLTSRDAAESPDQQVLPVLTNVGPDADKDASAEVCPSCSQEDGIRFLGSAIATLLSVSLSTLFGSAVVDIAEKKALVFTDSVQDAAHRAGFVQARSHALTLRAVLREAVAAGPVGLDELTDRLLALAGDDPSARYRLLPPELADRATFAPFWQASRLSAVPQPVRARVRRRLDLDAALELGLQSRTGRTLELTGSVAVEVEAGAPARMAAAARSVLAGFSVQGTLDGAEPDDATLVAWVRGVLERMRTRGAIDHPWFERYRVEDGNRWSVWGGRRKLGAEGMPAFPAGRPAPGYPRVGGAALTKDTSLEPVASARSWFGRWTARVLGVTAADGGSLVRLLLDRLTRDGLLRETTSQTGARIYALPPSAIVVQPTRANDLAERRHLLVCDVCRSTQPGSRTTVDQLDQRPCLSVRCSGTLRRAPLEDGFYRRLYATTAMRRIVAREHTSLLPDDVRLAYEEAFKASVQQPPDPNVLVATPTLEMGIDIGDLSTVILSSLPRTVASYLQRVGRAGRLTGNALNLAYVTGRGDQLPRLGDPLSVIDGEVRPPATYLQAEEILRRQLTAHMVDGFARDRARRPLRRATEVMASVAPGTFLGDLVAAAEAEPDVTVDRFLGTFPEPVRQALRQGLVASLSPVDGEPRTSAFAVHVAEASGRWQTLVDTMRHRLDAIDALMPELLAKVESPAKTDDDELALRSARAARRLTLGQLHDLTDEYWIGVLEEHGLLPNYTLLDDAVTLDVGLSWVDPDSGEFQTDHASFRRAAGQAIRELAPGATFYARGWQIAVDVVDLGVDGSAVRPWVFCPACGYAVDVATSGIIAAPNACPRCGSAGIADSGQRLDVVELEHVTAEIRRDEAAITDRRDERDVTRFQIVVAADVDAAGVERRWFVEGSGLGCTYLRRLDVRWLNLGVPAHGGARTVAGEERQAGLFRVCAGCGKLDVDAGANKPHEHRPWCAYRTALEERTRTIALSRTLTTQGLLLRLPYNVTVGDTFAVPSLAAALLLGLREHIGGHPDHLAVAEVIEPVLSDGSDNHDAILLHDVVPGGTGYLAELADPERLRELLVVAWQTVKDCPCRDEPRLACHRCLLPFALPGQVAHVSRAAAERHLRALLGLAEDATSAEDTSWSVSEVPPDRGTQLDSALEQRVYELLVQRLGAKGLGLTVKETPGPHGNTARFVGAGREWTLVPQVVVAGSKPDFVLSCADANVPDTAIFIDGHRYHATVAHNRLADDARKRGALRDRGWQVIALTAADVEAAVTGDDAAQPFWYSSEITAAVIQSTQTSASPQAYRRLATGAVDQLVAWVQDSQPSDREHVARAVPLFLVSGGSPVAAPGDVPLARLAADALDGLNSASASPVSSARNVVVHRWGALSVAVESLGGGMTAVALVLDDRDGAIDAAHADAWRRWLQLSNALALRDWPTTISTVSAIVAEAPSAEPAGVAAPAGSTDVRDVPAEWRPVIDLARDGRERALVLELARRDGLVPPTVGLEGPDGIPLDLAWPREMVAVEVDALANEDRTYLLAHGWRVLGPDDPDAVALALADSTHPPAPLAPEADA